jgi:hypothetical protein
MNVLWETMIDEMRAARFELDARRHFTAERQPIEMTRDIIAEWTGAQPEPSEDVIAAKTAMSLYRAASQGLIEVG